MKSARAKSAKGAKTSQAIGSTRVFCVRYREFVDR